MYIQYSTTYIETRVQKKSNSGGIEAAHHQSKASKRVDPRLAPLGGGWRFQSRRVWSLPKIEWTITRPARQGDSPYGESSACAPSPCPWLIIFIVCPPHSRSQSRFAVTTLTCCVAAFPMARRAPHLFFAEEREKTKRGREREGKKKKKERERR